jgi:hypothetical protein
MELYKPLQTTSDKIYEVESPQTWYSSFFHLILVVYICPKYW